MSPVPKLHLPSGQTIPQFGLGTWLSKPGEVHDAVKHAINIGYRHIDTAMAYGNQQEIGTAIAESIQAGKVTRGDLFVTSKIWNTYHSYDRAALSIDIILSQLAVDYVDLLLIHWPMGYAEVELPKGEIVPKDASGTVLYSDIDYTETWKAMQDAVRAGKVRSIGVSNFNHVQLQRLLEMSREVPLSNLQVELHPYFPQKKLVDFCREHGIIITAYSPLGNPQHMFRKDGQPNLLNEQKVLDLAKIYGKTPAQVILRWFIQHGIVVIPKSVNEKRLAENFDIFDFELNSSDIETINSLDINWRILGLDRDLKHPHYPFLEEF